LGGGHAEGCCCFCFCGALFTINKFTIGFMLNGRCGGRRVVIIVGLFRMVERNRRLLLRSRRKFLRWHFSQLNSHKHKLLLVWVGLRLKLFIKQRRKGRTSAKTVHSTVDQGCNYRQVVTIGVIVKFSRNLKLSTDHPHAKHF